MTLRSLAAIAATLLALSLVGCSGGARQEITVELNESPAAVELQAQLPAALEFEDRMGTAVVAELPAPLETDSESMTAEFQAGDVVYQAEEQSLIILFNDGVVDSRDGVVLVGRITDGLSSLTDCAQTCSIRLTTENSAEAGGEQ